VNVKRRNFFGLLGSAGLWVLSGTKILHAQQDRAQQDPEGSAGGSAADLGGVDPYFLDPGNLDPGEQESIESYLGYQAELSDGKEAVMPRGGRPKHAPTYRFLHFDGELGDRYGRFMGPLRTKPVLRAGSTYRLNAQILGLRASSEDWKGDYNTGVLSVETRARIRGESMTWLYAESFELYKGGISTLGLEYVAQRDGIPTPISTDESNIDFRIQLLRGAKKKGGILGKIFKIASFLTGGALGGVEDAAKAALQALPAIRVPQLVPEGLAFSQAVFGGVSEELPLWRSGFTSFGIAEGGSRIALRPGLWVALDETRNLDMRGCYLDDIGGRVALLRDGREVDANYLVLALEISEGPLPDLYYATPPDPDSFEDYGEDPYSPAVEDTSEYPRGILKRDKQDKK
jgi:hypothetical protein